MDERVVFAAVVIHVEFSEICECTFVLSRTLILLSQSFTHSPL